MASTIGIRELRASLATFLRRAQSGERITVTVAGRPVAQMTALSGDDTGISLDDLVARGVVEPPRRRGDFVLSDPVVLYAGTRLDRALSEVRR
ncbi:MAG: type II toxin-antitoxin system Phd/YefM family antitoxin [Acidimicrobiales bacterium]